MGKFNKTSRYFLVSFFVMCFITGNLYSQSDFLSGSRWKLTKMEDKMSGEVIYAEKPYFISFQDGAFNYSLEKNTCYGKYTPLNGAVNIFDTGLCTKMCCDEDISDKLNYNGKFNVKLVSNKLILKSEKRTYEFVREDK